MYKYKECWEAYFNWKRRKPEGATVWKRKCHNSRPKGSVKRVSELEKGGGDPKEPEYKPRRAKQHRSKLEDSD